MSKRKSSTLMQVKEADDIVFESEEEDQSVVSESAKGSGFSRVSGRAKKAKAIYDPSEFNGPVHKRKKEALEAERVKVPVKAAKASSASSSSPGVATTSSEVASKPKSSPVKKQESPAKPKIASDMKKSVKKIVDSVMEPRMEPVRKIKRKSTSIAAVPAVKEPSKRIQARKQAPEPEPSTSAPKKQRNNSASTGVSSDDYERASTVDLPRSEIPDVRKWSHFQVYEHFHKNLGFSETTALNVFFHEEIDGEALMIMKRSDIVTPRFKDVKLGTLLKMWSHILMFQTGSNDPTQAWK